MKNIFIGVDFSKKTFDVTMVRESPEGVQDLGYARFDNDKSGYAAFYSWARRMAPRGSQPQWLICGETTGIYSEGLAEWACGKGLDIWIENAYGIKHSLGLARGKDDRLDSRRIAIYAQEKKHKARLYKPLDGTLKELKVLLNRRRLLDACRKALKNSISEEMAMYGGDKILSAIYAKIESIADEIKGVEDEMQSEMASLAAADRELGEDFAIVHSFRGIGDINAVAMLVYTDNFRKYPTANKMATAWGVAPFRKVSGTSIHSPAHVSFHCDHWLKGLLTCAANAAILYDGKIGGYYARLIAKGKAKGVAYNNVKSKIIHIIFTMVHNKTMYDPHYDEKNSINKSMEMY